MQFRAGFRTEKRLDYPRFITNFNYCIKKMLNFVREVLQMMVSLKRYVFDLENLVELVMIGLVAAILFLPEEEDDGGDVVGASSCDMKRHLAAIALGRRLTMEPNGLLVT